MAIPDKGSVDFAINYICNTFNVGDRLIGQQIACEVIGIGRPQYREAIVYLEAKGVLSVSHGKSTIVAKDPLSSEEHY